MGKHQTPEGQRSTAQNVAAIQASRGKRKTGVTPGWAVKIFKLKKKGK